MQSEDGREVSCPRCGWRPLPHHRWICGPVRGGCGTVWNTFTTRAVCPGCGKRWCDSACLACLRVSQHDAWYGPRLRRDDTAP
jgi:hypothetical protein